MIRPPTCRPCAALALALALTACHGGSSNAGGQKAAAGEVLSGSVSDAMLPLDSATSQPPRAAGQDGPAATGDDTADEAASGTEAAAPAATAEPSATPPG